MPSCVLLNLPECILRSVLFDWCEGIATLVKLDTAVCSTDRRAAVWNQLRSAVIKRCSASPGESLFRWLAAHGLKVACLYFESPWTGTVPEDYDQMLTTVLDQTREIDYLACHNSSYMVVLCLLRVPALKKLRLADSEVNLWSEILTPLSFCCNTLLSLEINLRNRKQAATKPMVDCIRNLMSVNKMLEELSLCDIPFALQDALLLSSHLRTLSLSNCLDTRFRVKSRTILTIVRCCTNLTSLEITESLLLHNGGAPPAITDEVVEAIAAHLPSLQHLTLKPCFNGSAWTSLNPILYNCRQLSSLVLSGCTHINSEQFALLLTLPVLSELFLAENSIHTPHI